MIKCPGCGRDNAANFNFCLDCGYDLKAYREAFPDGPPAAPPLPAPAVTVARQPATSLEEISKPWAASLPMPVPPPPPIVLPDAFTPASSASPLPPPPRFASRPQVALPETPSFPPVTRPQLALRH